MTQIPPAAYRYTSFSLLFLTFIVIGLGAWTRLVDAGLGCPDWPGCYGFIGVPNTEEKIALAESRFPESPVEIEKGWPEMIHRYAAGLLGLCIFVFAAYSWKLHRQGYRVPVYLASFLAFWVVCQAVFGWWTVSMKLWPKIVTIHLLGGMLTLSCVFLLCLKQSACMNMKMNLSHWSGYPRSSLSLLKKGTYLALFLVVLQIALGGWLSSNYAALICPDFPQCHGSWWPKMDFVDGFNLLQPIGVNYLGGQLAAEARTAIHYMHRILALLIILLFIPLMMRLMFVAGNYILLKRAAFLALLVLLVQVTLGITNVLAQVPLSIAIAHNLVAACLLLSVLYILFLFSRYSIVVP